MKEEMIIENKHIRVGEKEYRLHVTRVDIDYTTSIGKSVGYIAYLLDVNSEFHMNSKFNSIEKLEKGLRAWIIKADMLNDPEGRVFEEIRRWDGVIET